MGRKRKYSPNFERDWDFYVRNRELFSFSGSSPPEVLADENGSDAKKAFHVFDSQGKVIPCHEPDLLREVLMCKASVNLHLQMWAEGRADGTFGRLEAEAHLAAIGAPDWLYEALERQRVKVWIERRNALG